MKYEARDNKAKRVITILTMLLTAVVISANPISRAQARQKAETFLREQGDTRLLTPVADGKSLSRQRRAAANEPAAYYVFNRGTNEGFVIVSGDDRTEEEVLGYSDAGDFEYDNLPPALQGLLEYYARQITALQQTPSDARSASSGRRAASVPTHPKVEQLLTCTWSQGEPYNRFCPIDKDGRRSVTGCVATAMAQILYFHREKMVTETQAAIPGYTTWNENPSKQFDVEGIPEGSPIDWDNMKDKGGTMEIEKNAVAHLMHYCGVSVQMGYTGGSSGAQISAVPGAMINYFGMNTTARHVWKGDMTDVQWDALIYNDLSQGRPVYLGGYTSGENVVGHAFVTDGYDGNRRYHINWGWGGSSDGYYLLTNLTPGQQGIGGSDDGSGYSTDPNCVVGIEPLNYATRPMSFSDATVRRLCAAAFDADGDGKVTYGEAATVTDLGETFKGQRIQTFPELYYFTGLTTLGDDAFNGCTLLTSLRLPKELKGIGNRAFNGCSKLTALSLPSKLTAIGNEAFRDCKVLADITLPSGLKTIGDGSFQGCLKLEKTAFPISLIAIGSSAFANCAALTSVTVKTFSPGAIKMGTGVFEGAPLETATLSVMEGTQGWFSETAQWCDFGTISVERELSAGQFVAPVAGETYYLYHVGTGQYMTKGEAWGTQAIVGSEPMRFKLNEVKSMPEGTYHLTSEDTERTGKYLFRTSDDGTVGKGVKACFVDGTALSAKNYWKILRLQDSPYGEQVYTIQIPATDADYKEGRYLGVQTDHASNAAQPTYGVYSDVEMTGRESDCMWRFVPYDAAVTQKFKSVNTLANLLEQAKKNGAKTRLERAVYDNIESTDADIRRAQRSLRRKLNYVDFADASAHKEFVDLGDLNSDGELSKSEAAVIKELNVSFKDDQTLTSLDALRNFTSLTTIPAYSFSNCKALRSVSLASADPTTIKVSTFSFTGVPLADCTLHVPMGSEEKYRAAAIWKNFGKIVGYRTDAQGLALEQLLANAAEAAVDATAEQAVYDNADSNEANITTAIASLREKLHYIDFTDTRAQTICLENWDTTLDGELSVEEAAAVSSIDNAFSNISGLTSLEVLRYFTGLKEIPTYAFRNTLTLKTVYIPAGVKSIGELAFSGCNNMKFLVILNDQEMLPQQMLGLPSKGTALFVPSAVYDSYRNDSAWQSRCYVSEYTGRPSVTIEATRQYSYSTADVVMRVSGAPVDGEAAYSCPEISDNSIPVGTYAIAVSRGTIANDDVELRDGVLTIEPVSVKVTAKSYTRNVGEPNPDFEVSYVRFRNRENASVLTTQPVISCEATVDSPAGVYPITVSGAEAQNYVFTYVEGTLTIVDPTGIVAPKNGKQPTVLYDLQGRRTTQPRKGLYIQNGVLIVVK